MSSDAPAISVLMPVYNAQRHLREAMDSILAQSFGDFEFLSVDDGSTDDSPQILKEYATRDPRVRIVTKANGGVTSALNAGLKVARGEFVARMDADDVADPSRFELQIERLRRDPQCVAVGCQVIHTDAHGVALSESPPMTAHEEIAACLWDGNTSVLPHFGVLLRRSALTRIGNYREEFRTAQDLDLYLRLTDVGTLSNIPRPLMRYRVHEGSVGARKADEQARNAREILRQAYQRRGMEMPKHLAKWKNGTVSTSRLRWGWQAIEEGRYSAARSHALAVLRQSPRRKFAWQLALHAFVPFRAHARAFFRMLKHKRGGGGSSAAREISGRPG